MNDMKLEIKNFGPINKAEIDIGKITVIAGPNASGKTTSSKLLYCLLASNSSEGVNIINQSFNYQLTEFSRFLQRSANDPDQKNKIRELRFKLRRGDDFLDDPALYYSFIDYLREFKGLISESQQKELENLEKILRMSEDNKFMFNETLNSLLDIEFEFKNELYEIYDDCRIKLSGSQNCDFSVEIIHSDDDFDSLISKDFFKCIKINEVSYFETPYILDFKVQRFISKTNNYHQEFLIRKLTDHKKINVFDKKLNENVIKFQKKIEQLIEGKMKFDFSSNEFVLEKKDKSFSSKNIASGVKSLGILQMLLEKRKLPEDSCLIMDEPEVHLHPEWQIKLAEILVQMSKELNVTVYINTHSPHFIEAIEVFSKYYQISKKTNFYLTIESNDGKFDFRKVGRTNLGEIYNCLGNPYDVLDKIRGENDAFDVIEGRD